MAAIIIPQPQMMSYPPPGQPQLPPHTFVKTGKAKARTNADMASLVQAEKNLELPAIIDKQWKTITVNSNLIHNIEN